MKSDGPRLVVLLSVDQMRYDFFTRFEDLFEGGLKKVYEEGLVYSNAHHVHSFTGTAPGHATLATGNYPSNHGIIENDFYDPELGRMVYCVADPAAVPVGLYDPQGPGVSPRNLEKPTLGDRLKNDKKRSKVFGVSFKDRSSVLMTGSKADQAFWFDLATTAFVSSNYYMREFPKWTEPFLGKERYKEEIAEGWHKKFDDSVYERARQDDFLFENGRFLPSFPHTKERMASFIRSDWKDGLMLYLTPLGDKFTLEFSKELIEKESLGKDPIVDYLAVGCSMADAIGHHFGPYSQEVLDYYLRLDEYLGDFIDYLDEEIGRDNYLLVFTSDHGVLPMPEYLAEKEGIDAKRIQVAPFQEAMYAADASMRTELGLSDTVFFMSSAQGVNLRYQEASQKGIAPEKLREAAKKALEAIDFVEAAYSEEDVKKEPTDGEDEYLDFYRNSYFPGRGHDIKIRFKKHYLVGYPPTGTTHGSPYEYDSRVPLIFFGKQFKHGVYDRRIETVDVAPTIAEILNLKTSGMDGTPLKEVVKNMEERTSIE